MLRALQTWRCRSERWGRARPEAFVGEAVWQRVGDVNSCPLRSARCYSSGQSSLATARSGVHSGLLRVCRWAGMGLKMPHFNTSAGSRLRRWCFAASVRKEGREPSS